MDLFNPIKDFAGKFFGFDNLIQSQYGVIQNWQTENNKLEMQLNKAHKSLIDKQIDFDNINSAYVNLFEAVNPTKYPNANITYQRPIFLTTKTNIIKNIDVRCFIMKDFTIFQELKDKDLLYTGKQDLDELIPTIKNLAKKSYKYAEDITKGLPEWWFFPFETREFIKQGTGVDCDDWSIYCGSYLATAMIPSTKWFISAGNTRSGFGHATLYAESNKKIWHHMNSTNPNLKYTDLNQYPNKDDTTDTIGIKDYWFSFNNQISISTMPNNTTITELGKPLKITKA